MPSSMRWITLAACTLLAPLARSAEHPGNVFFQGEDVRVAVPSTWTGWTAVDVEGKEIAHGPGGGSADLGTPPVGYFEVRQQGGPARITAAVLAKVTPVEQTPIALDTAMSWFYAKPDQIRDVCKLCQMAGVRWIRERSSWPELETARGTWAPADGRYERAMRLEHEAGLKILQVNHVAPPWASKDPKRFPDDLRRHHLRLPIPPLVRPGRRHDREEDLTQPRHRPRGRGADRSRPRLVPPQDRGPHQLLLLTAPRRGPTSERILLRRQHISGRFGNAHGSSRPLDQRPIGSSTSHGL